ncbi:MAG: ABC transporter permease [Oscillospiraceae bacterium]
MILENIALSLRNIKRKKFRTVLTIAGIVIGVASVVIISTIGDIGKIVLDKEFSSLGMDSLAISSNEKTLPSTLTEKDLKQIKKLDMVDQAVPIITEFTQVKMKLLKTNAMIWGIDKTAKDVVVLNNKHGRFINDEDSFNSKNVCVVDEKLANDFYGRSNIVGKTINITFSTGEIPFEIIGVVETGGNIMQGIMGEYVPSFIYIPYTTIQRYSGRSSFDQIAAKIHPEYNVEVAEEELLQVIQSSQQNDNYKVENLAKQKDKFNSILDIVTLILSMIAAISLLVSGLNIMTVMIVSVNERTKEIGIKKSIGAKKSNILFEFIVEAFSISVLGCIIGCVVGLIFVASGCYFFTIPFFVSVDKLVFYSIITIAIGTIFGVYPAIIASNLKPIDALRSE